MPKPVSSFVDDLSKHLRYIEQTRSKTERLFQKEDLVRRDLELVYAGLYLDAITSFEHFIEDLFMKVLVGKATHPSRLVVPTIAFKSPTICQNIVYGGRSYVNWFPYEQTQERAEMFFQDGLPFTALDDSDKNSMKQMLCIRNAIAHKSKHALNRFEQEVISGLPLLSQEKKPVGYLRSNYTTSPPETRYESIIFNIVQIARKLCTRKLSI